MRVRVTRVGWPTWLALGFAMSFAVLAALVVMGTTQPLDSHAISELRPGDAWGAAQVRYSPWMSRLEPDRMYVLLVGVSLASSAWRRSWWPVVFGVLLAGSSVALTVLAKLALQRPDPHGYVTPTGGSYPSGHVVAVLVCIAGCLLLLRPRMRWWLWTPVLAATGLMAQALLVSAAHWPTDVLGGALLALALVSASSRLPLRQRAVHPALMKRSRRGATTSAS